MTDGKSAPNRLREVRKEKGLTLEGLAELLPGNTAATTISRWESGVRPISMRRLKEVALALGVPVAELMEDPPARRRLIPILGSVRGGNWREAIHDTRGELAIDADVPGDFALEVEGDSMDKIAPEGSHVVVSASDLDLHEKKVYVVANDDGEATFKRFMLAPARLEPASTNEAHKPIRVGYDRFQILGRVTMVQMTL